MGGLGIGLVWGWLLGSVPLGGAYRSAANAIWISVSVASLAIITFAFEDQAGVAHFLLAMCVTLAFRALWGAVLRRRLKGELD